MNRSTRITVGADSLSFGVGPMVLDVSLARDHGWSQEDINRAAAALDKISRHYGDRAQRRHPERYLAPGVFNSFFRFVKRKGWARRARNAGRV